MNTDSSKTLSAQLTKNLQTQLHLITHLNAYLDDIKHAITKGSAEQLNQLLAQQPDEFSQLETTRLERTQILADHGYTDVETGLKQFMQQCSDEALKQLHVALNKAIDHLEKSLLINELIIRKNQQRVRQTLQVLSGHDMPANNLTYSREGNTDQQNGEKHCIALA